MMRSSGTFPAKARASDEIVFQRTASFEYILVVGSVVTLAIDVNTAESDASGELGLAFPLDVSLACRATIFALDY